MSQVEEIIRQINVCPAKGRTKLVAIDGRGGAGKSSLAAQFVKHCPDWQIVSVDSFPYSPEKHPWHELGTQTRIDWERLRDQVLLPLAAGHEAIFERTPWWKSQSVMPNESVAAGGTVIVEGCYSLLRELRDLYDFRIWIECSMELALENAVRRDGPYSRVHWEQAYIPNENSYVQKHKPYEAADIVIKEFIPESIS